MRAGVAAAAAALAMPILAEDVGRRIFEARCAGCHTLDARAAPGAGPHLGELMGRRLAGDARFDYSPALQAARERGEQWDSARLDRFLTDPEAVYTGLWMGDNGVPDANERAALLRWLGRLSSRP